MLLKLNKMNLKLFKLISIFIFITPYTVRSTSLLSDPYLGLSPQDVNYYKSASEIIKCKDGSNKFNRSHLNDDFCDCLDGSDEPGTSACPNGRFYCRNAGHIPLVIFSSRVNDGICDCCDGSDEYDGKVKCQNTCWEAGKAAREKLKKKIATYQEGITMRKKEIEQAKLAFAKDEAELSKLKSEEKVLKGLVDQLKDRKEQIEKQEERERLEREKEEKLKKEAEKEPDQAKTENGKNVDRSESTTDDVTGNIEDSEQVSKEVESELENADGSSIEESHSNAAEWTANENHEDLTVESKSASDLENKVATASKDTEELSKEELGRLVGSRWTGKKSDHETGESDDAKDSDTVEPSLKDVHEEDYDGYASEFYEDDHKYDETSVDDDKYDESDADHTIDDVTGEDHVDSSSDKSDSEYESEGSDITASSNPSWLEKIQKTVKSILHGFSLFQTPLNTTDAARVRKEYDDSSAKLSKIQSRISTLSEKVKLDFGPEKEFYSYYDRCFEGKENKYVYKICPFKKATQEEGHMTTRLGRWEKFEDSYKVMLFSNGDKCWNGPDRSMKVKLRCGLKNEVTDVDEPSRCEYVALLSTPSVCHEERLKELQQKFDALNNEQPLNHDEL